MTAFACTTRSSRTTASPKRRHSDLNFNAREWVRVAKNAGMKYIVITAKHHDGFCMYDTKLSDYSIAKATPFRSEFQRQGMGARRKKRRDEIHRHHGKTS